MSYSVLGLSPAVIQELIYASHEVVSIFIFPNSFLDEVCCPSAMLDF